MVPVAGTAEAGFWPHSDSRTSGVRRAGMGNAASSLSMSAAVVTG